MPEALILALPIVGGFLAATTLDHRRYQIARDSGYRLYFKIVHYALLLTAGAVIATQTLWTISAFAGSGLSILNTQNEIVREIWHGFIDTIPHHKWHIAILAFGFGNTAKWFLNSEKKKQVAILKAIADQDFELMIAKSQSEGKPILITLSTGKVYVGWAVKGPNPEHKRFWIRILPLASGYRDKTQKVKLTVFYGEILQKILQKDSEFQKQVNSDVETADLEVVLSFDCIVGMHLFDIKLYQFFDPAGAQLFDVNNSDEGCDDIEDQSQIDLDPVGDTTA